MKLFVHQIDPHYSHDFADLCLEGKYFCVTEHRSKPVTPLEMIATFKTQREATTVSNFMKVVE